MQSTCNVSKVEKRQDKDKNIEITTILQQLKSIGGTLHGEFDLLFCRMKKTQLCDTLDLHSDTIFKIYFKVIN